MTTLSVPAMTGYQKNFKSILEARKTAAELLGCALEEMVEVVSGDGVTTYCYATQKNADEDREGAYAVHYITTAPKKKGGK